ncbi:copper resistance CopC/CopD family protein [Alicyclobacillus shizuokensis]|uniref:copper resistance CopC/CopD family protein n=1 Tax=Alicyclobacillus shizuokensis TaxID=392014 RepID=UPI0008337B47|nr:copper resistance protein CopC [Alicyclobacillus shizuokensis]MCL6625596.1 copper resistance protein CopC [Alicyclobacillus shizuokensis]
MQALTERFLRGFPAPMRWRGLVVALAAGLLVWVQPLFTSAHAYIVRADPAAGAVVHTEPRRVQIWFDESVQAVFDAVRVVNQTGQRVDERDARIDAKDPHLLECTLQPHLSPGLYTVEWRVISADGHPVSGDIPFRIAGAASAPGGTATGRGQAETAPAQATRGYVPGPDMVVIRGLSYLGVAVSLGATLLITAVLAGMAGVQRARRRLRWLRVAGSCALLVGVGLSLPLQTRVDADIGWGQAFSPSLLGLMLSATKFGHIWPWQLGLTLALLALSCFALLADRALTRWDREQVDEAPTVAADTYVLTRVWLGLLEISICTVAAAVLLCQALTGHAGAETAPVWPVISDVAHMLAASVWLGGVVGLLLLAFAGDRRIWVSALRRFGPWAGASLVVLAGTGLYAALLHVPTWYALWRTSYGRTLLIKVVLVFIMALLGALHFWLVRRGHTLSAGRTAEVGGAPAETTGEAPAGSTGAKTPTGVDRLPRRLPTLWMEAGLGVCILAVTAVLANLPTAMAAPGPVDKTLALAKDVQARVQVTPNVLGVNRLVVQLTRDGKPDTDVQQVTVTFTMLDMSMPNETVRLQEHHPGRYTARGAWLSMAGHWRVRVHVLTQEFTDENAELQMVVGSQSAD